MQCLISPHFDQGPVRAGPGIIAFQTRFLLGPGPVKTCTKATYGRGVIICTIHFSASAGMTLLTELTGLTNGKGSKYDAATGGDVGDGSGVLDAQRV